MKRALLLLAAALPLPAEEPVQAPKSAVSIPRPDSVERYAVLTNVAVNDPWNAAVEAVVARHNGPVVRIAGDDPLVARPELVSLAPGTLAVVVKPETLDVDWLYRLIEMLTALDQDFALDCRLAFVTGRTPEDAVGLLDREGRVENDRALLPKRLVDFGPSEADIELEGEQVWLEGWERLVARHLKPTEAEVKRLEGASVLQFWGHGRPEGIAGSVDVDQLESLDLFPAVAFGGPIYTGVTHRWWEGPVSSAPRKAMTTAVERSFALAVISRGATGFFGATDPGHGVTAMQEMEAMLGRGLSLGETHKQTADAALMFLKQSPLKLPRIAEGKAAPSRDWGDTLARGALSRVAFGDPAYRPFEASAKPPFGVERERVENGLRVKVTIIEPQYRATLTDVFQYGFGRRDALLNARILAQIEWPDDMPLPLKLRVLDARAGTRDIRVGPAIAAVELWGARRIVHVQLDLPAQSLAPGSEIRFLLRTGAPGEDQPREALFEAARGQSDAIQAARDAAGTAAGPPEPPRRNLWGGAAGVALFQMNLFRATSDGTQGARARGVLDALLADARRDGAATTWLDTWRTDDGTPATLSRDGLHNGTAGIGDAFLEGFRLFGDRRYLEAAIGAGERLAAAATRADGEASWGDDTTVAGGAAGILMFLLDLSEATGEERWLALAAEAGAWLESVRVVAGDRCWWRAQTSLPRVFTGMAHGTAGVALALLRLGLATKNDRWRAIACDAARWLDDQARRSADDAVWPAVAGEGDAAPAAGWSFGTAGIVRFFARLHAVTDDPAHLDLCKLGARGVKRLMDQAPERPFDTADFAEGGAGIGEMFLDLFQLTRDGAWRDEASRVADALRFQGGPAPSRWAAHTEGASTLIPWKGEGLYPGGSGVGMFYLRLATIDMDAGKRPRQSPERR